MTAHTGPASNTSWRSLRVTGERGPQQTSMRICEPGGTVNCALATHTHVESPRRVRPDVQAVRDDRSDCGESLVQRDIASLYAAVGEPAPKRQPRVDLLKGDPAAFVRSVYVHLGGTFTTPEHNFGPRTTDDHRNWDLAGLARKAVDYLQLWEALGRAPVLDEFTAAKWLRWDSLGGPEAGFERFVAAVQKARVEPNTPMVPTAPANPATDKPDYTAKRVPRPAGPLAKPLARGTRRLRRPAAQKKAF